MGEVSHRQSTNRRDCSQSQVEFAVGNKHESFAEESRQFEERVPKVFSSLSFELRPSNTPPPI
jgi:hypothetical protein